MATAQKAQTLSLIALAEIFPSKTNPRKFIDPKALQDLASSIKEKGILEPLLLRVLDGSHEIVAGERRYRAAKVAGLKEVPAIVRELTDQQVAEIQVVENMQRQDLTPLEEAQGYRELHEKHGYTWDDLALKIGKGKDYIYTRLHLLDLSAPVQKAMAEGKLPISWADQFTRVKDPKDQETLLARCGGTRHWENFDSLTQLKKEIEEKYLLRVKEAPFEPADSTLCPAAGSCFSCPKRTGAQVDLFGEAGKLDTCLDSKCWGQKVEANKQRIATKLKAAGKTLATGPGARKLLEGLRNYNSAYVKPSDKSYELKGNTTWGAAAGGKVEPLHVLDERTGEVIKVFKKADLLAAIPKDKFERHAMAQAKTPEERAKEKVAEAKRKEKVWLEATIQRLAARAAVEKAAKMPEGKFLQVVVPALLGIFDHYDVESIINQDYIGKMFKKKIKDVLKEAVKAPAGELKSMLVAMMLAGTADTEDENNGYYLVDKRPWALISALGIDPKKFQSEAVQLLKEGDAIVGRKEVMKGVGKSGKRGKDKLSSSDEDGGPTEEAEEEE